jgi:hypothetical protein
MASRREGHSVIDERLSGQARAARDGIVGNRSEGEGSGSSAIPNRPGDPIIMRVARPMLAALVLAIAPGIASAQVHLPTRGAAVTLGQSSFDLSGTGSASIFGLRGHTELGTRWLVGDVALSATTPTEFAGRRVTYLVPEAQLQLQIPFRTVRPFLGLGVGSWISTLTTNEDRRYRLTVSGSAGLRLMPASLPVGLLIEGRVRGIGRSFGASTADLLGGITWQF